jgi:lipoprotein NlpD
LRHTRSICALGLWCLLLNGCADTRGDQRDVYVVRPQDTVYSIAWRYGLDFRDLARWNHIGPDFRIAVGQTLILAPVAPVAAAAPAPPPKVLKPPPSTASAKPPAIASALSWAWPTDRMSAPQPVSSGGILLPGRVGQDIRAASSGRVVYNGSGIRGYGNLIIIKHGENLLSAYAHTRESLVHDGQEVALGQVIAHMGEGAPQKPVLYFEIRRNGKPVDPLAFLPAVK